VTMQCWAAALAGVMAITVTAPAYAQSKPAKPDTAKPEKPLTEKQKKDNAAKAFKEANEKFDKGDYAGAVVLYEEADTLFPGAKPKQRAAASYDKLNKPKEAVAWYEKFLADNPDPAKFTNNEIADAKTRLEALKKTPAKVKVTTDPPAPANLKLMVDDQPQPGPELAVPPGKHKISATADGFDTATQEIEVAFADTKEVTLALTKAAPPPVAAAPVVTPPPATTAPPKDDKPAEAPSKVPAYVTLGLAGAGVVVGTIFGIQALGAKSDFEDDPTTDNADSADRNALIADMSFAVALTFGVTGTVLLLSSDKAEEKAASTKKPAAPKRGFMAAPYATPKGGGAAARFTF
jgi:hypothetical protein